MSLLLPSPRPTPPSPSAAKAPPSLDLPAANECPTLDVRERTAFAARLHALGEQQHIELPRGISDDSLITALNALDKHLGTPDPHRDPGSLKNYGPLQRQLRVLLWKHSVADYNDRRLNMMELLEHLQSQLASEGRQPPVKRL